MNKGTVEYLTRWWLLNPEFLGRPHLVRFLKEISAMRSSTVFSQSPIYSLPLELLSYIFVLGAHSPPDTLKYNSKRQELPPFNADSVKTPLIYSAVCRHWRTVALGTAALWTNICITAWSMEMSGFEQEKRANLTHITSSLSLSRNYPLNILLDARDIDWDFAEPE